MSTYLKTSEYVSPGHPDKVADQISDRIVDFCLSKDRNAKVACETLIKGNHIHLAGEISSDYFSFSEFIAEIESDIKSLLWDVGYHRNNYIDSLQFSYNITEQSPEINSAVVTDNGTAAGDQGIMFGYACYETPTYMPLHVFLAREVIFYYYKKFDFLEPDMKAQVTVEYDADTHQPIAVKTVIVSLCYSPERFVLPISGDRFAEFKLIIEATKPQLIEHLTSLLAPDSRPHFYEKYKNFSTEFFTDDTDFIICLLYTSPSPRD